MTHVNRVLDLCVPPLVIAFILWGSYIANVHIGFGYLLHIRHKDVYATLYTAGFNLLVFPLLRIFLSIWWAPRHGDTSAKEPPRVVALRAVPFECGNEQGDVLRCWKDGCSGSWKAPRSHHCRTCGVCKNDFDHHCPWVGNCISRRTLPSFLQLVSLTPIVIGFGIAPVLRIQTSHIISAYTASCTDTWVLENFWKWKWSWVVYGGPIGRCVAAVVYGYRILQRNEEQGTERWSEPIIKPRLSILFTVIFAVFLALFTAALSLNMLRSAILRGETTFDVFKRDTLVRALAYTSKNEFKPVTSSASTLTSSSASSSSPSDPPPPTSKSPLLQPKPIATPPLIWLPLSFINPDISPSSSSFKETSPTSSSIDDEDESNPLPEAKLEPGLVIRALPSDRLYDTGSWKENLRRAFGWGMYDFDSEDVDEQSANYHHKKDDDEEGVRRGRGVYSVHARWRLNPGMLQRIREVVKDVDVGRGRAVGTE